MLLILKPVTPTLVSVVGRVLVCPTVTVPKSRLTGLSSTTVPIPVRLTFCGLFGALSTMANVPFRVPLCVGLKITLIVQLAPEGRLEPQLLDSLKLPFTVMLAMLRDVVP